MNPANKLYSPDFWLTFDKFYFICVAAAVVVCTKKYESDEMVYTCIVVCLSVCLINPDESSSAL